MLRAEDVFDLETRLYDTLGDVLTRCAAYDSPITAQVRAVEQGRAYLLDNLYRNVSLHELATLTGLSPYHFLRAFRQHTGLPPHAYQLQQRIVVARRLLAAGQPIAHVSAEMGFADQSHFARKFKAFVGATPGEYVANAAATISW
jgi:AraC-like DNA-binding protein